MSFTEKLDEKSLEVFNAACSKNCSSQAMFFLNAFWDEFGDQSEFIFAVSNQIFRMADMKAKGIMFVHLYDEGKDLDFDMGIYHFEQLCKFWDDPSHEWFRGSVGLAAWAAKHPDYQKLYEKIEAQLPHCHGAQEGAQREGRRELRRARFHARIPPLPIRRLPEKPH